MKKSKISVVVPCFNEGVNLVRAVESVVSQTLPAGEIIVVDDGSTNDTVLLLKDLNLPGVRVVSQTHIGISAAHNRGVWEAENDYIAFLDARYTLSPVFLEAMRKMILKFPSARCFTSGYQSNCGGRYVDLQFAADDLDDSGTLRSDYFHTFSDSRDSPFNISSTMMHRSLIEDLGGFTCGDKHMQDLSFFIQAHKLTQIAYMTNIDKLEVEYSKRAMSRSGCTCNMLTDSHMSTESERRTQLAIYTNRESTRRQIQRKTVR